MGAIFSLMFMAMAMMIRLMFFTLRVSVMLLVGSMRLIGELIEHSGKRRH